MGTLTKKARVLKHGGWIGRGRKGARRRKGTHNERRGRGRSHREERKGRPRRIIGREREGRNLDVMVLIP